MAIRLQINRQTDIVAHMQWKDYIAAIADKGLSQSQIAKQAGCGQATISDLASGKTQEPRHSLGVALMRIGRRHGIKTPKVIHPPHLQELAQPSTPAQEVGSD